MNIFFDRGRKPINIKKTSRDCPGNGWGSNLFMCCFFLGEKGKHINKFPRKFQENAGTVLGQSWDYPGTIP